VVDFSVEKLILHRALGLLLRHTAVEKFAIILIFAVDFSRGKGQKLVLLSPNTAAYGLTIVVIAVVSSCKVMFSGQLIRVTVYHNVLTFH
jgi:hypothetical protein